MRTIEEIALDFERTLGPPMPGYKFRLLVAALAEARALGTAEMREIAARHVAGHIGLKWTGPTDVALNVIVKNIRDLPVPSEAPAKEVKP